MAKFQKVDSLGEPRPNRRGGPGVKRPGGPGAPVRTATIRAGNPVRAAIKNGDAYALLGTGVVSVKRSGSSRVVSILLEDGTTIILTVF